MNKGATQRREGDVGTEIAESIGAHIGLSSLIERHWLWNVMIAGMTGL
jgi:hypothetical protein